MAILSKGTTYADGDQITSTNLNALVDSATFAAGAVANNGVELNGSGQLEVRGNVDIGTSNLTATGTISLGATTFNDNNITNVGSIAVDTIIADNTDVTIDAAGDIILDADGAQVRIKDGGTERFVFNLGTAAELDVIGDSVTIHSNTSDADIIFKGNDGGSTVTALTLDMSAAGAATFNDKVVATELDISGDVDIGGIITISDATPIIRTISNSEDLTLRGGNTDAGGQIKLYGSTASSTGNDIHYFANEHEFWNTGATSKIAFNDNEISFGSAQDVNLYRSAADTLKTDDSFEIVGNIDVDGTTNLDVVDIDGAVDMATTLAVAGNVDFNGDLDVDGTVTVTSLSGVLANGVTATTQSDGDNSTKVATTAYVDAATGGGEGGAFTTLTASGDVNFDSGTFFTDVSANRVGILNTSPSVALDVTGELNLSSHATLGANLVLKRDSDAWTSTTTWLNISDYGILNSGGSHALTLNGNGYRSTAGWTSFNNDSRDGATQIWQYPEGYITFNANNNWATTTDGTNKTVTERMRINGDTGNVGINDSTPTYKLDVNGTGRFVNDLTLDEDLIHNRTGAGAFPGYSAGTFGAILEDGGSNGSTLYMSRKNSWALYLATDTTLNAQSDKLVVFSDLNGQSGDADNIVGDITITSSATAFNTSSDYRLKENEVDISDGIDRLNQLKPYRFNFKKNTDRVVDGFFAHEVSDIVPEAITGTKDAMKDQEYEVSPAVYEDVVHPAVEATYDEDGNELTPAQEEYTESVLVTEAVKDTRSVPDYQGIDQSKLVPLLTAALQEAVAKIEALEARVQTLEG
jgi:hypothetical protein